jgi:hypothetical protein
LWPKIFGQKVVNDSFENGQKTQSPKKVVKSPLLKKFLGTKKLAYVLTFLTYMLIFLAYMLIFWAKIVRF